MNDDRVMGGVFVALVFFGWLVWMVSRIAARVFQDLGVMFDAIGAATVSFFVMAWAVAQLMAILSAGAAVLYAAYRYYRLVRRSTEIIEAVEVRCHELTSTVEKSQKDMEKRVSMEVARLRLALAEALAKPEVGPELPKELPAPKMSPEAAVPAPAKVESVKIPRVSNPY